MKLFAPKLATQICYAVVGLKDKEGTAPRYISIKAADFEVAEAALFRDGQKSAYPYPLGRYDEQGRYCTYKPPIDGVAPGRYVLHPMAYQEWLADKERVY